MSLEAIPVSSIMVKEVRVVGESASVQQACQVMISDDIGSVVIVTNPEATRNNLIPVGIITERDVVRQISLDPYRSHFSVGEIIKRSLITIPSSTSIRHALRLMVSEDIRRLPVVENSKLAGIVTDKDIYRLITKDESLIAALLTDELLVKHIRNVRPEVYDFGQILHKRI